MQSAIVAGSVLLILSGCGGHKASSKEIVPKIESYKAALGIMGSCGKQVEGAKELILEVQSIYKSRAFNKYTESAIKEVSRAERTCEKYERYKGGESSMTPEALSKLSDSVVDTLKGALTVIENGISQQEAYKAFDAH